MARLERFPFTAEQWLPYPVEMVFAFFAQPQNLPRLMPGWQKARIEDTCIVPAPTAPEDSPFQTANAAGDGTRVTLSFRPLPLLPVHISWEALIEEFHWNKGFCDVQVRGPFRYWRQCHLVRAAAEPETRTPGTILRDEIEYELPLPCGLRAADWIGARPQIAALFAYRHKRTRELLSEMARR